MTRRYSFYLTLTVLAMSAPSALAHAADKPIKAFILAGQSNMVGWGDSTKLPQQLRTGSQRVLMFEAGKWQPLRPHEPANRGQRRAGLSERHFGPEIGFAHALAQAWPDETIGIIKLAVGGTSLLAWKPDWSKQDADRVGQGKLGSLYKKLTEKVAKARESRDIQIVGMLWLQGGGDMKKVDVAKEYLGNLKSLVTAIRKETGVSRLPFFYGSPRANDIPDDLSDLAPHERAGRYPAALWVLKAQFDARKAIPYAHMVILRDIEKHPANVHYNTAGQLKVGKLFADAYLARTHTLSQVLDPREKTPAQILAMLGAKGKDGIRPRKLDEYHRIFGFIDTDRDGNLSTKEFVEDGRYLTRQARQGIFRASDANADGVVSQEEYVTNRIITDEAKTILSGMDEDSNGRVTRKEFVARSGLPRELSETVFGKFDTDGNGELVVPEYLRVWGRWARGK